MVASPTLIICDESNTARALPYWVCEAAICYKIGYLVSQLPALASLPLIRFCWTSASDTDTIYLVLFLDGSVMCVSTL